MSWGWGVLLQDLTPDSLEAEVDGRQERKTAAQGGRGIAGGAYRETVFYESRRGCFIARPDPNFPTPVRPYHQQMNLLDCRVNIVA